MKNLNEKSPKYWLAHKALPKYIFNNTELFIRKVCEESDQEVRRFVNLLWDRCQREAGEKPIVYIPQVIKREFEGFKIVLLTMPLPDQGLEAFYAVIAYNEDREVRYFVLENSLTKPYGAIACVCEWTKNSKHINYGFTDNIEVECLIDFVQDEFLNNNNEPQSMSFLASRFEQLE